MRTLSKLALVVDWQYFVDYPEWESVDVTHPGHGNAYWEDMQKLHESAAVELPKPTGHIGFWDQFSFSDNARLYVSDANIMAIAYLMRHFRDGDSETPPWDVGIWCFDRHHDAIDGLDSTTDPWCQVSTESLDWQIFLQSEVGVYNPINVVLPDCLKGRDPRVNRPPATVVNQFYYSDVKDTMPHTFDFVFVCRSSNRVPTWCDGEFNEFIESCPIPDEHRKVTMKPRL